ncbi:MAG: holo-[acyl-carrier-protein] synthase [Candidatus Melainabacteria bacterium RIFOXYA12_FULL_32_12]|nr:MAG: holo-[acyl-carrier-protein] synthase [Candidatus Melainabacteria bacterium RIFOXYA2_FULL_32_9]OGI30183.1 MAG: holo-[acyl-carrier-protein] synthase [Candidatus Melainabacteria bacterium RIFOXYA12_FULL_32_12]
MRLFLGTDICEIDRIQAIYDKYGEKFLKKTFTDAEIRYCLSKPRQIGSRLAVRFATKEAASKALGVGINKLGWNKGINWKDIELIRQENGSVSIKLYDKAYNFARELGITKWSVSVSHSKDNAISTVIGYNE